jgi:hypothetical protein
MHFVRQKVLQTKERGCPFRVGKIRFIAIKKARHCK